MNEAQKTVSCFREITYTFEIEVPPDGESFTIDSISGSASWLEGSSIPEDILSFMGTIIMPGDSLSIDIPGVFDYTTRQTYDVAIEVQGTALSAGQVCSQAFTDQFEAGVDGGTINIGGSALASTTAGSP